MAHGENCMRLSEFYEEIPDFFVYLKSQEKEEI